MNFEKWFKNKDECKRICNENPKVLSTKKTKGGFEGTYLTWTLVYKWLVKNYEFQFEVVEIKTSNDGSSGYVIAKLTIDNVSQQLALTLETFQRQLNGKVEFYQETPEQLQMRVFVKLVANITGFGFHLWEK